MTLAGIASQHAHNALSASAAALAIGLPRKSVVEGLRAFLPDPESNPARANVYTLGERIVVIDYAHNEAGIEGLAEIARGLCGGAETWIAFGAGDRDDAILHGLGYRAARGVDHVVIAELQRYLRGREADDLVRRLRAKGGSTAARPRLCPTRSRPSATCSIDRDPATCSRSPCSPSGQMFALLDGEMGARRADPGDGPSARPAGPSVGVRSRGMEPGPSGEA